MGFLKPNVMDHNRNMPESSTLLNLRMIAYLLKGIDSGDHTHILSFTFLGGFNAFITLLKIRVMSFLLTDGCLSPKDSIYKTLCPRRANSTVTCCLLVQKGLSQSAVDRTTISSQLSRLFISPPFF